MADRKEKKEKGTGDPVLKRVLSAIAYTVTGILVFLAALIGFSSLWAVSEFGNLDMDEIVFHLQQPLEGAGGGVIPDYLLKGLLPAVLVLAVYIVLLILLKKGKRRLICALSFLALTVISIFLIRGFLWDKLRLGEWIEGRLNESAFVQEHYADPSAVRLEFPKKKRNLIWILLESVETTYSDISSGGAFKENPIPELTQIAMENEDFSGTEKKLNGGIVLPGGGFTTGAIFAQTAGLPLRISIGGNFMDTQKTFFPQVTSLGDILQDEGYRQVFLIGSDAVFGGRKLFFEEHGGFEIRDYAYAKENGWISPDYEVWWGYEDEKLFSFAKETLSELAGGEAPFALTLLTVDTHYEDGYVCRLCKEEFPGNQYANVMACSSRQTAAFLSWLRSQPFYENTTVIITGDHTTMDTDFCRDVPESYQRKVYTSFINSAAVSKQPEKSRLYSTLDLFPTALAALGVRIEGERLALGTNLYSSEETLLEQYGTERVKKELSRRSVFLENLEKLDGTVSDELLGRYRQVFENSLSIDSYDPERKLLNLRVSNVYFYEGLADESMGIDVSRIEVEYREKGKSAFAAAELKKDPSSEASYIGTADLKDFAQPEGELRLNLYTADGSVFRDIDSLSFRF